MTDHDKLQYLKSIYDCKEMVDDVQYILMPEVFYSISQSYEVFPQTTDEEVVAIMDKVKKP